MSELQRTHPTAGAGYLSLLRWWGTIRRRLGWIVGCTVAAAAAALGFALTLAPTWAVSGVAQVAAVSQSSVESATRAVERVRVRGFQDAVLRSLQIPTDDGHALGLLFRGSLKVKQLQNTDFVELRLRAPSAEEARRWIDATVRQLAVEHERLAAPAIERLRKQVVEAESNLKRARAYRDALRDAMTSKEKLMGPGERFAEGVYNANLFLKTDEEIRGYETQLATLAEALSAARTFPTMLVHPAHVTEAPVSPKTALMTALGAALGLVAGLFVAYFLEGRGAARRTA
jgi:uncharacterized protein involved in exopolysaccharide biosynthesis